MEKISVKDKLPEDRQYVLAHLTKTNWGDSDDPEGKRYWVVAKFKRGLSAEDREKLPDNSERKKTFCGEDEWSNNLVPFVWDSFGPSCYFGQEVDCWCELPD